MNVTLIAFSIIFIIASLHAFYRDKIIMFDKISKAALSIFLFNLIFFLYYIAIASTSIFSEYTFFMLALGLYVIMSGNILSYIKNKES